jgi:hypothetical protein
VWQGFSRTTNCPIRRVADGHACISALSKLRSVCERNLPRARVARRHVRCLYEGKKPPESVILGLVEIAGRVLMSQTSGSPLKLMELIYVPSEGAHYNLARLLRMQYEAGKEEILEGEIIMLEGNRHFDDRKRTGKFKSTSQLHLTFDTESLDVVRLRGDEADQVYEEIIGLSRPVKDAEKTVG